MALVMAAVVAETAAVVVAEAEAEAAAVAVVAVAVEAVAVTAAEVMADDHGALSRAAASPRSIALHLGCLL